VVIYNQKVKQSTREREEKVMTGYKVTVNFNGKRVSAFTGGLFKTTEDAGKYLEWIKDESARVIEVKRKKIVSYYKFDANAMCGVKSI